MLSSGSYLNYFLNSCLRTSNQSVGALGDKDEVLKREAGDQPQDNQTSVGDLPRSSNTAVGDLPQDSDSSVGDLPRSSNAAVGDLPRDSDYSMENLTMDKTSVGDLFKDKISAEGRQLEDDLDPEVSTARFVILVYCVHRTE